MLSHLLDLHLPHGRGADGAGRDALIVTMVRPGLHYIVVTQSIGAHRRFHSAQIGDAWSRCRRVLAEESRGREQLATLVDCLPLLFLLLLLRKLLVQR